MVCFIAGVAKPRLSGCFTAALLTHVVLVYSEKV